MNHWKLYLLPISITLVMPACQNKHTDAASNSTAAVTTPSMPVADRTATLATRPTEQAATFAPVEILLPTHYRKASGYPQNVAEKEWYELYKDGASGKWVVAKADLDISYGRDECVGDDVMIIRSKHDDAVVFFTPFAGMGGNPEPVLEGVALFPERNVTFHWKSKTYSLSPMGSVYNDDGHIMPVTEIMELPEDELEYTRITDYVLTFVTPEGISFPIAEIEEMQSVVPKVVWAGDLNNDGSPDFVLNLSDFYESQHIFLLLSDPTDSELPLKKAGDLKVVNDC